MSVLPIFWFIINIFVISSRFLFKGYLYSWNSFVNDRKQTIIYGAGNAGVQILENLKKSTVYAPIAFIDDDKSRQGTILNSLEVFSFDKIEELIKIKAGQGFVICNAFRHINKGGKYLRSLQNSLLKLKYYLQ